MEHGNYYKKCRQYAGLTQEVAAELLGMSVRQLSNYESDEPDLFVVPPDHRVDKMAEVYDTPLLAMWHLQKHNPLGRYFPEVQPLQSVHDMGFQTTLAVNDISKAEDIFCGIMEDGKITPDEADEYERYKHIVKRGMERMFTIHFHLLHSGAMDDSSDDAPERMASFHGRLGSMAGR